MGTKANPGKFDCYANAAADEPLFVLLARDKHAPTLVWLWTVLRELDGESEEVVNEARDCAVEMMRWAHDHDRKVVGIGQAALAGVMELIRAANAGARAETTNEPTRDEVLRRYLAETRFEK